MRPLFLIPFNDFDGDCPLAVGSGFVIASGRLTAFNAFLVLLVDDDPGLTARIGQSRLGWQFILSVIPAAAVFTSAAIALIASAAVAAVFFAAVDHPFNFRLGLQFRTVPAVILEKDRRIRMRASLTDLARYSVFRREDLCESDPTDDQAV